MPGVASAVYEPVCLDTGHHCYCDGDPVAFPRRHAERTPYLHLKSCDLRIRDEVRAAGVSFAEGVRMGVMCEPAKGDVDFIAVVSGSAGDVPITMVFGRHTIEHFKVVTEEVG